MASNESPAGGKSSRFGKIPGSKLITGTVGAVNKGALNVAGGALNVAGDVAGGAFEVAGKVVDTATLGQLKTTRSPPPDDELWQLHREPAKTSDSTSENKPDIKRVRRIVGGWIDDAADQYDDTDFRDRVTFLEYYLKDKFFGDWYHNAAVIFVTSFVSWLVARLGGGLIWIVIIVAFTSTYYRTSILRVRRNVRDDIAREAALNKLETDAETMEWLNSFLIKFWAIYLPSLNAMVIETANQVLSGTKTPPPIDSLELKRFTLGTKPPRIDLVRTYPKTEEDIVVMDWGFSFTPNDIEDLTSRQLKNKVNPLVELSVRIGKGVISKGLPILLQDMAFKGMIQVKIKLITSFPHIQTVSVSFLRPPYFDFILKPIGGETLGFDVGFIPGLEGFIKSMVHENLGPMLYDPHAFTINVQQMLAGAPNDAATGVLAVTIYNGRALQGSDRIGNTVDPYVKLSFNGREEVARTSVKSETTNPRWNETKLILVSSLSDALTLDVIDFNDVRKDKPIGVATFPLEQLSETHEKENVVGKIIRNGKNRGELIFDARYFPVLEGKTLEDGTKEAPPLLNTGIIRFTCHQAKDLDEAKRGNLNPFAVYYINNKEVYTTKSLKHINNPVWDEAHEELIDNYTSAHLKVVIRDEKEFGGFSDIARYKVKISDIVAENEKGNDWFKLTPGGRVRLSAQWKPVALKGVSSSGGYVPPIGVFRFNIKKAASVRNLETVGKVDPYVRVKVNNHQKARTVTIHSTLDPEWNEVLYATSTSENEKIVLDVMDSESGGKDRTLGEISLAASNFIKKNEKGEYINFIDPTVRSGQLTIAGKSPKGVLYYTVSFFPTLNVVDPEQIEQEEKAAKQEAEAVKVKVKVNGTGTGTSTPSVADSNKPDSVAASVPVDKTGQPTNVPQEIKKEQPAPPPDANSIDTNANGDATSSSVSLENGAPVPAALRLKPAELFEYQSGLVVYKIIEGNFSKSELYVQVFFDDLLYPSYISEKATGRHFSFGEVGDALVRELDFSKVEIRVTSKERALRDDDDGVVASTTLSTLAYLKLGFNKSVAINLQSKDNSVTNQVKLLFKYIPVLMQLDPSESRDNQGLVQVRVLDASDLPAADRRGKSDPYCEFELDDKKVFKTKVIKRTLTPAWNEVFETQVTSRTDSVFKVAVYDWDMASDDDLLGSAIINLGELEPFERQVVILKLDGKSGQVRLEVQFKPDYVVRSVKGETTFSGTFAVPGKVVTSVAGAPIKGVGFAAGGVSRLFRHNKKEKTSDDAASIITSKSSRSGK
ncbi:C2 domain-containing protein [Lipomyces japonicus]|uniref:C2 domain-containing protein n=1 Tax=Lipomyces japonicus TaxID=56871 RepID=UPI0034CE84E9